MGSSEEGGAPAPAPAPATSYSRAALSEEIVQQEQPTMNVLLVGVEQVLVKTRPGADEAYPKGAFDFNEELIEAIADIYEASEHGHVRVVLLDASELERKPLSDWERQDRENPKTGDSATVFVNIRDKRTTWTDPTSLTTENFTELQYQDGEETRAVYEAQAKDSASRKVLKNKPDGFDTSANRPENSLQLRFFWDGVRTEDIDPPSGGSSDEKDLAKAVKGYVEERYQAFKCNVTYVGTDEGFKKFDEAWHEGEDMDGDLHQMEANADGPMAQDEYVEALKDAMQR